MASKRKKGRPPEKASRLFPNIRRLLRTLRENRNLSREDLALETGLSAQQIGRIETGPRQISLEELDLLAGPLGIQDLVQLQRRLSWFRLATESGLQVTGPMELREGLVDLEVKPGGAGMHAFRVQLGDRPAQVYITFEVPLAEADRAQTELLL